MATELILYMHPASYFSKIALLTLHEKQLAYKPYFVNSFARENLHPWFLKLNPKGQLPVLQDGDKIIPGSDVIIHYLEQKYDNEHIPKVLPAVGTEASQKVQKYVQLLRTFQSHVPTYGIFNFPDLYSEYSMKDYEWKARLNLLQNGEKIIDELEKKFPEVKELLREKKAAFASRYEDCKTTSGIEKGNRSTEVILDQIESELSSHSQEQQSWLCCEDFTEADITLAVLLFRLEELGFSSKFLNPLERPFLLKYWKDLKQRQSFNKFLDDLEKMHQKMKDA